MICCGNVCWTWGELTDFKMCHYFLELLLSAADDDEQCLFMLLLLKHALPPLLKMVKLAVVTVSSASGLRRISWNSSVLEGVCVQNQSCAMISAIPRLGDAWPSVDPLSVCALHMMSLLDLKTESSSALGVFMVSLKWLKKEDGVEFGSWFPSSVTAVGFYLVNRGTAKSKPLLVLFSFQTFKRTFPMQPLLRFLRSPLLSGFAWGPSIQTFLNSWPSAC